ncbi:glycosyltransferase family 2 protein [Desulfosoma caldarium]|uniref:Dolichol-phosphate mannosyltransferase n=1 Tax=Desulfosoma caldarium TaxID=610254 RepID=A0A3N1UJN4_9BACT|nr:glycosyltransferase family 2 protein [Desulfosoma caldarium]ROQ89579.1 dolichol-phosphate mannosyltransferase [Desulfosoma caldarium]
MDVSIVIPVYNEAENVLHLAAEVEQALKPLNGCWECLWIDDGSTDDTWDKLLLVASAHPGGPHRLCALKKNAGQSAALWVGFQRCRGRFIATLDGDGQNDPRDIPRLVALLVDGRYDMVQGYREARKDSLKRRLASRIANGFRNLITGKSVRDVGCSTRVFRRECLPYLPPFKGLHRFLPTLLMYQGFRIAETPVNHRPRRRGTTKYGIFDRLWVGLLDIFGVSWLRVRGFRCQVVRTFPEQDTHHE